MGFEGPLAQQPEMLWLRERGVRRVRLFADALVVAFAATGQGRVTQ
ncbi:MAG TPA: hypothetical protein VFS43_03660 [Polyangiaceae bacterium]|nr:hypothetical protein [Polyangiaceae bacterium]